MSCWTRWLTSGQARRRVDVLDLVLAVAQELAQPGLEGELGSGAERGELVLETDRPGRVDLGQGGQPVAHVASFTSQSLGRFGMLEGGRLRGERLAQLVEGRQHLAERHREGRCPGPRDGILDERIGEAWEPALGLEARVAQLAGRRSEHGAEREWRLVHAHPGEVSLVERDDPAPLRVDVHLGDRDEDRRAGAPGAGQECELRAGQLGRRVGHEHEGVGRWQEGQGRRRVGGVQTAHPRRVDQRHATFEERIREAHLHHLDTARSLVALGLRHPAIDVLGLDRLDDEVGAIAPTDDGRGHGGIADDGHGDRCEVVVDRTHVAAEQGIDQRALALLELADDAHDRLGPPDSCRHRLEALGQIATTAGVGQPDCRRDDRVDGLDLGRWIRRDGRGVARRHGPVGHRRECTLRESSRGGALDSTLGQRRATEWQRMDYSLGIDLGTTYSAAATAHDDRVEIFQLGERAATIPSIVVLRADGEVLTGDAAERRSLGEPTRTAREFKRRLGDPTPIILGGTPYGAEALLAHLLRAIVGRVSQESGGPPAAIVVTHPASYGAYKIDLLEQAIRQAEVEHVSLLTEPEAAAIYYAQRARRADAAIAVYDFGGGTFDATILRKTEAGFEQLGRPEGMERLGGIDFDEALFRRVMTMVQANGAVVDPNDPATLAAIARLREECRRAKEALSSDTDATIAVVLPGLQTEMRLTREEFEEMIRPRITETIGALGRAVKSAGLEFGGIDRILLVGGSSRIPLVAEMVREATGRPVAVDAHPKHSMALGAAYVAEERRRADTGAVAAAVGAGAVTQDDGSIAAGALVGAAAVGAVAADGAATETGSGAVGAAIPPPVDPVAASEDLAAAGPPAGGLPAAAAAAGGDGAGRGRMMAVAAAVGAVVLVAVLAVGASGMLSGGSGPSSSPVALASASGTPLATPTASPSPAPSVAPTATTLPTATPVPTPTPTPSGRAARIMKITVSGGKYVVDFKVFGYTPKLPGMHVHFFFDTVKPADAGVPGKGPWKLYATPNPFTQYKVSDRPAAAKQMCILVANPDHSVIQGTGNCVDLPS